MLWEWYVTYKIGLLWSNYCNLYVTFCVECFCSGSAAYFRLPLSCTEKLVAYCCICNVQFSSTTQWNTHFARYITYHAHSTYYITTLSIYLIEFERSRSIFQPESNRSKLDSHAARTRIEPGDPDSNRSMLDGICSRTRSNRKSSSDFRENSNFTRIDAMSVSVLNWAMDLKIERGFEHWSGC